MFDQLGSAATPPPPKLHGNLVRNSRGNLDVLDTPQGIIFNSTTTAPNEMTRQEDSNGYQLPVHPNPLLPAGRKADGQGRQPVHGSSGLHEHRWLSRLNRNQTGRKPVFSRGHHRIGIERAPAEDPEPRYVGNPIGAYCSSVNRSSEPTRGAPHV